MNNSNVAYRFHLGIYGILLKNSSILLVKKSRGPYTGKLDLPGGKAEHGESPTQTLVREIGEETGVRAYASKLFDNYSTVAKQITEENVTEIIHHMGMIYLILSYDKTGLIHDMDVEDSLGAHWYQLDTLQENMLSPFACQAIRDVKKLVL